MKYCPHCNIIKPLLDFKDDCLITGYGRYCSQCKLENKSNRKIVKAITAQQPVTTSGIKCPRCGSMMIVRERRSDKHKFYGCSRFPNCRETKPFR